MPSLRTLDLHENSLEGGIPTELVRQLLLPDLSSNQLSGTISQWSANSTLVVINLSKNELTGEKCVPWLGFSSRPFFNESGALVDRVAGWVQEKFLVAC